ncbi:MAG: hypothetical protein CMJ87_06875 [Planctomycetes bacterium]|nr:hypothetical protein [Planctomycetota bacterium]
MDVAGLVPRDVDFFVARGELAELFDPFPSLAVEQELEATEAWRTLMESEDARGLDIEGARAALDQVAQQLPGGLAPLDIFGGADLALAGYFRGAKLEAADWAVYGRVNWLGKLGAELLSYPGLLGLEASGLSIDLTSGHPVLSGADLPRPLHISRVRDVVIISTAAEFIDDAGDLAGRDSQDSFLLSARYHDHIQQRGEQSGGDALEAFVDLAKLFENLSYDGAWPNRKSQDFLPQFLARLVQLADMKETVGVVDFDGGLALDVHAPLSSENLTAFQTRLYRQRGFDRARVLDAARYAPADTSLFLYLQGDIGDLLREAVASMEPAMRKNLEDLFRGTGRYATLEQLILELDGSLKNRLALIMRPNDYPDDAGGPPHDNQVVPAVGLVMWLEDGDRIVNLRDLIGGQGARFGLQGRHPGEQGYYSNKEAGFSTREFWSPLVPGTGVIATVNATPIDEEVCIIANSFRMLGDLLKRYTQGGVGGSYPNLANRTDFVALLDESLPQANLLAWVDPRSAGPYLREWSDQWARFAVEVDWVSERAKAEDQVIAQHYPGKRRGRLTDQEQDAVDGLVDPILRALRERLEAEQVPVLRAAKERQIVYGEAVSAALFMLAFDPRALDASLRIVMPLD